MKTLLLFFVVQKRFHLLSERFPLDPATRLIVSCGKRTLNPSLSATLRIFPCFLPSFVINFLLAINPQIKSLIITTDSRQQFLGLERANF